MANAYEIVMESRKELVDTLIKNMESGYFWNKNAWNNSALRPYNPASDCYYLGGNRARLMIATMKNNYDDPRWCTYNQAKEKGWTVKRGAKSILLEKWIFTETKTVENETGELIKETVDLEYPKVNYFRVFNASQIHGIPKLEAAPDPAYDSIIQATKQSSKCLIVEKAVPQAHYIPIHDIIELPLRSVFKSSEAYLSVLVHEMSHSTGHPDRLNRQILNKFGTPDYAREELRAELGGAFFKANLNIPVSNEQLQDHSDYLKSWIQVLKDDPNEFFRACKDAEQISDYLYKNYDQELEKQAVNSIENFSDMEQREIIFRYETVNHIPDAERMTRWYTEMNLAVQRPFFYSEQHMPISQTMIEQRCAEILNKISPEELNTQFCKYWSETLEKIINEVIQQVDGLKNRAAEDIQRQGTPYGSWIGRIAHPERPEDYIEIDITGYRNTVVESATVVMGGNVQDTMINEISSSEYLKFHERDNTGFTQSVTEKISEFDPSVGSGYCLYAPDGLSEHSLEEHYRLLNANGYHAQPDYNSYNLKMHEALLPKKEMLPFPEIESSPYSENAFWTINIEDPDIPNYYDTLEKALDDYFTQPLSRQVAVYGMDSRALGCFFDKHDYTLLHREYGVDIINPERSENSDLDQFFKKAEEKLLKYRDPDETYMDRISTQIKNMGLQMTPSLEQNLAALHSVTGQEYYIRELSEFKNSDINFGEGQPFADEIYSECRQQQWEHLQELMAEEVIGP